MLLQTNSVLQVTMFSMLRSVHTWFKTSCFNHFAGGNSQLDFDAICENDDTAMTALMNYLEADGGLGDPADLSDIQWAL